MLQYFACYKRERSSDSLSDGGMCVLTERLCVNWQLLACGLMQMRCERHRNSSLTLKARGHTATRFVCV